MKYDWSRCNNLEWKTKNNHGFIKIIGTEVTLFTYEPNIDSSNGNTCYSFLASFHSFEKFEEAFPDLEIIPRNPNNHADFKEGDIVLHGDDSGVVLFSTPRIIIINWIDAGFMYCENGNRNFTIQLTDYEKQLILESRKDIIHFKPGDKVIGRDEDSSDTTWDFGIFEEMSESDDKPIYICKFKEFTECVPFNEETYKLLGTTNDYGN